MERKNLFQESLKEIQEKQKNSVVQSKDVDFILVAGFKLLMEYDRVCEGRAKWRLRAEIAEVKLKTL